MKLSRNFPAACALALACAALPAAAADGVIRIGVTIRMISNDGQRIGQMLTDQFDEANKAGGFNGHKVEVTLLNDECKTDKGVANAIKLVSEYKVHLLVGSTCSSVSLPIVDITARAGVPQLITSSTAAEVTMKKSAWVFRPSISERFYNAVVGKYVGDNVGKKVAYVWTSDAASQSFARNMITYMKQNYGTDPTFQVQATEQEVDYRTYMLKIKDSNPDALSLAGTPEELARMLTQANEVGIPATVARVASSNASVSIAPQLAGDNIKGLIFSAAFTAFDPRPNVRAFVELTKTKYEVPLPDHDFSQAYDLAQILKLVLAKTPLQLTDASLAADRTALRDALANVKDYQGVEAGPIGFCADPTPQCRDGNRTPLLIEYTKGGASFEQTPLKTITFDPGYGL
jgi:ABC-type branched-subunit amino acid transport system substrate-binding protein